MVLGSKPVGGEIFRTRADWPWSPPAPSTMGTMGDGSFPRVKRPGLHANHPTLTSTHVKERVKLYIYSHSEISWPVLGRTLTFTFMLKLFDTHLFAPQGWFVRNKLQQTQEDLCIRENNAFSHI